MGGGNTSGHQLSEAIQTPSAIITPVYTALAPDVVLSEWLDPPAAWDSGGDFRTLYTALSAIKSDTDWIQIGPHPVDTAVNPTSDVDGLAVAQRAWAVSANQSFVDMRNLFRSYSLANTRGLMGDDKHLSTSGWKFHNAHLWSVLPLGSWPLGAEMVSTKTLGYGTGFNSAFPANLSVAPITVSRNMHMFGTETTYVSSSLPAWNSRWGISVDAGGNFTFKQAGSAFVYFPTSSNRGISPAFDDMMLGGFGGLRWRAQLGGVSMGYRAITSARTLDTTDHTVNCTSGTFTVTLPSATTTVTAAGYTGRIYRILNKGAGTITIGGTVDGVANPTLAAGAKMTVQSTGAAWIEL